jgi:ABC-type transport system involved in cytochrome bd biosynthesis fused ATPase/permease subunit
LAQEQLLKLLLKVSLASQHILDQDSKHWDQFLGLLGSRDSLELVYLEVVSLLPVVLVVALLLVVQQVALQVLQLLAGLLVLLLLVVDLLLWPHLVQDLLVWLLGVGLVV